MQIATREGDSGTELWVKGRLDAARAAAFDEALQEIAAKRPSSLVVRMKEVDFLSSPAIAALLRCCQTVRAQEGAFAVLEPSDAVRSTLRIVGLLELIRD